MDKKKEPEGSGVSGLLFEAVVWYYCLRRPALNNKKLAGKGQFLCSKLFISISYSI